MPQLIPSGSGAVTGVCPEQEQYRGLSGRLDYEPLFRPYYVAHATPSSAVHQLHMTGSDTWNTLYNLDNDLERRFPVQNLQPQVVVNYVVRNPAAVIDPAPIPIAQYAINTGLIYVGPQAGTWGGIQVGSLSGAPSGY